jgi:Beta/Gamma crystallin
LTKTLSVLISLLVVQLASSQVTLYSGPGFTGNSITIKEGNYKLIPTAFYNKLKSVKISEGYVVELFSMAYFNHKRVTLYSDTESLPESWGLKSGSLKVFKSEVEIPDSIASLDPWKNVEVYETRSKDLSYPVNYNDTGKVIAYSDCHYIGKQQEIGVGKFSNISAWSISSIKIPADKKILIYKQKGFKGTPKILTNDDNCLLTDWNNKIASIKVIQNSLGGLLGDTGYGLGGLGIKGMGSGGGGSGGGIGASGSGGGYWGGGAGSGTGINVVIYDKCNLTGRSRSLGVGEYGAIPSGTSITISSIRIPTYKRVQVFAGRNFTGNSTIFYATQKCLPAGWNDKILSMKILE